MRKHLDLSAGARDASRSSKIRGRFVVQIFEKDGARKIAAITEETDPRANIFDRVSRRYQAVTQRWLENTNETIISTP